MAKQYDLILKKRVSVLNAADLNFKSFIFNLGKAVVSGSCGDFKGAGEYSLDALQELGLKEKPEQAAWLLVSRALMSALTNQLGDYQDLIDTNRDEEQLNDLAERLDHTLNAVEVSINASFFERPQDVPLLEDFKSALVFWLQELGMNKYEADAFHDRLKSQFVLALHQEWAQHAESYVAITSLVDTPFTKATQEERSWQQYNAWLKEQANARVFSEAFGLNQIYIRLRAYYEKKSDSTESELDQNSKKIVCDLHNEIEHWVKNFDKDDSLCIVSGGPGCGKSSFAKILAADLVNSHQVPVLFVPLHHFNLSTELIPAIGAFVQSDPYLRGNPIDPKACQKRLLMIFDGLDELSMQGKAATESAQQFVEEVMRTLDRYNNSNTGIKWQAIITGRDLAIQANASRLRKTQQVLHALPYFLTKDEHYLYQDEANLLALDQRDLWWKRFAKVKGKDYQSMPTELTIDNLNPITREPLLNYLIALSYERREITFDENTSLNAIYYDLLKAVHERRYEHHQHAVAQKLSFEEFMRVLEEIALAVWHGNGRIASAAYLYKRCKEQRLDRYLEKFSDDAKQGVVRLLTAFYFREFGRDKQGNQTFEFTHKSFGEYLTALRIVKEIDTITSELERYEQGGRGGWSPEQAYLELVKVCGPTTMDHYLFRFIKDEIAIRAAKGDPVLKWQTHILNLLALVVRSGSPMERSGLASFNEMLKYSRNAEESLLAIHYACACQTQQVLSVSWGEGNSFGSWMRYVLPQRLGPTNKLLMESLAFLNLNAQIFDLADFFGANLEEADLARVDLAGANLEEADLAGAHLAGADLARANLERADLERAVLERAVLERAVLERAVLAGANLERANLAGAHLERTYLTGANLEGANLEGANLVGAHLEGANLVGANLEGADIKHTILDLSTS